MELWNQCSCMALLCLKLHGTKSQYIKFYSAAGHKLPKYFEFASPHIFKIPLAKFCNLYYAFILCLAYYDNIIYCFIVVTNVFNGLECHFIIGENYII